MCAQYIQATAHTHTYTHMCTPSTHTHPHEHHPHIHTHTPQHIRTHTLSHIHIRTHTHTFPLHTYTYTYTFSTHIPTHTLYTHTPCLPTCSWKAALAALLQFISLSNKAVMSIELLKACTYGFITKGEYARANDQHTCRTYSVISV